MTPNPRPVSRDPSHRARRRLAPSILLAAAAVLGACGGGGGGSDPVANPPPTPIDEKALIPVRAGTLLAYFRQRLTAQPEGTTAFVPSAPALDAGAAPRHASTTIQEAGVDEDDLLKTDGRLLVSLSRQPVPGTADLNWQLGVHRREDDGSLTALARAAQDRSTQIRGLYLTPGSARVAVLGAPQVFSIMPVVGGATDAAPSLLPYVPAPPPQVTLALYNLANPATPARLEQFALDGTLVASRLIGQRLYLVTQWYPAWPADVSSGDVSRRQAALDRIDTRDLLPKLTVSGGAARPLVEETDCLVQQNNASLASEITTISVIDLSVGSASMRSRCFVGGTEAIHLTTDSLYLATTRYPVVTDSRGVVYAQDIVTDFHKFALAGDTLDYRATGSALGHLGWDPEKKSYRMSEHQGDLRVITYTARFGWATTASANGVGASPALLTVLRENSADRSLRTLATLPNARRPAALGAPDEQIYAVRFLGPRAYLVTFRRIDPLYLIDLSDPADPRLAGEIKAPGFSDYLFPITERYLLGVGKDASAEGVVTGVKVSVFDVGDPANAREVDSRVFGAAGSQSTLDVSRHGINLMVAGTSTRAALPVRLASAGRPSPGTPITLTQGLLRLSVDHATGRLTDKPLFAPIVLPTTGDSGLTWALNELGEARSVQIADHVYYLSGGELRGTLW